MSIENIYQAMPECTLLERARRDTSFEWKLKHFASYAAETEEETSTYAGDQSRLDFVREAKLLCKKRPDLVERKLLLGRYWDAIHYLLSEYRRERDGNNNSDWVKRAVNGGDLLNPAAYAESDSSLYYTQPEEVKDIRTKLEQISDEEFERHWDASAMDQAGVYKIYADESSSRIYVIRQDFEELRDFYREAADSGDGVLVWFS